MAELDALAATPDHHKQLAAEQNPPKPITSLLYRAAIFLLVAALPFFPSQAPEFVNQTLLTRGWELLHLLLVGIAVSYGLFSQRNAEPASEKEAALRSGADGTPQSYLTRILQVSPVFDEEGPAGTHSGPEESRLEMWTSRYQRGEPRVLVAPGSPGEGRRLLLPVRSLRSPVPRADSMGRTEEHEKHWIAGAGDLSFPGGRAGDRKVREAGAVECPPTQEGELAGDSVVDLPSPIPWRSWSARMELMEEMADTDAFRSLSFRSLPSRPSSAAPSPRRLSPAPSVSPEPIAKTNEDPWKRKIVFNASPPPPAPPFFHKTPSPPPVKQMACRSFRDELTTSNVANQVGDDDRGWSSDLGSPRSPRLCYYSMGRSVRTVRPRAREVLRDALADVATPVTVTREKEKRKKKKKKTTTEADNKAATASDARDSDEASWRPSEEGELPAAAAGCAGAEQAQEAEENEVDKKADEFIAKFREQIRLQRIDSIKKTGAPGILRRP